MQFVPIALNHHEKSAHVEKLNSTIRSYLDWPTLTKPRSTLVDLIAAATFYKSTCWDQKKSSFFNNFFSHVPNLSTANISSNHNSLKYASLEFRRRQLQASANSRIIPA